MLRSRALDRSLTRLALLAVLLLALAPSVSRALAGSSTQVLAGWSELCTAMGLESRYSDTRTLPDAPPPPMTAGEHCDYCPLAATLSLPPAVAMVAPALLADAGPLRPVTHTHATPVLRGLGSRGPPATL